MQRLSAALLLAAVASASAGLNAADAANAANPIRKVVSLLQQMQQKVMAEGEKEKALFEKYMCWCKTSGGDLNKAISDSNVKVPQLQSDIEEAEATKVQLEEDLKKHQADRAAADEAMKSATAIREKDAAAAAAEIAELKSYISAINGAVAALEKGMVGGFLQTKGASLLKRLVLTKQEDMNEADRDDILAFLSGGSAEGYVPSSGGVTGILKQMSDEFSKSLADSEGAEAEAVKNYEDLMAAKKKEIEALTKMIEDKLTRVGQLGVEIAQMKNDLTDTEELLIENQKFLEDLEANCGTKTKEWEVIVKTRAEELVALSETIKILNDDDALELFKKTLPSASLLEVKYSQAAVRDRALAPILRARRLAGPGRMQLDFIALALRGKKVGFEKVIKMIDDMVATLKQEQLDDDHKHEYCAIQFDSTDDKKKGLEHDISDLETAIAQDEESIATMKDEIKALGASIAALDKSVTEATAQRKAEHQDFTELMAMDSAAKEVILYAKNRLAKFYNPKLYKPPPKRELTEDERISVNMGGTLAPTEAPGGIAGTGIAVFAQVAAHHKDHQAPPPPPEAVGAYRKKSESNSGVLSMMDLLVKDLDKEMTEAQATEEDSQEDYEKMMRDSAEKRAEETKASVEKAGAKAELEGDLEAKKDAKVSAGKELMATMDYIASLHAECDWLLKYFDVRKEARADEIDALGKAKAVLSGADFSFVQQKAKGRRSLRAQ